MLSTLLRVQPPLLAQVMNKARPDDKAMQDRMSSLFSAADEDGSGGITSKELARLVSQKEK